MYELEGPSAFISNVKGMALDKRASATLKKEMLVLDY
jgi:hypothetical protein